MKFSTCSLVLATIFAAAIARAQIDEAPLELEARQATGQILGAPPVETQVPAVTTQWLPGPTTYLPYTYTQLFVTPVVQGPAPGVGTIGLGTLAVSKREEAEPLDTGIAGRIRPDA